MIMEKVYKMGYINFKPQIAIVLTLFYSREMSKAFLVL